MTTQDRGIVNPFFLWKNVHDVSCSERGILFFHGNKLVLTSHVLWAAHMWDTTAAEVLLLILDICYHGGGYSEESNNPSLGTNQSSLWSRCFHSDQSTMDFVSGSWCSKSQHNYGLNYTNLILLAHIISGSLTLPKYPRKRSSKIIVFLCNFFLHSHFENISFEVTVFFVLCDYIKISSSGHYRFGGHTEGNHYKSHSKKIKGGEWSIPSSETFLHSL